MNDLDQRLKQGLEDNSKTRSYDEKLAVANKYLQKKLVFNGKI